MRVYLDTNVLVYAVGIDSPHREPCRDVLRAVAEGRLIGETSVYTIQEFVRQRVRRGDKQATARARHVGDLCADLHPVDDAVIRQAIDLVERHAGFDIGDAVHLATALTHGVTTVLSADGGLDRVDGIERIDPLDSSRLAALMND
jgi:predicted nucleic acid-binding protein